MSKGYNLGFFALAIALIAAGVLYTCHQAQTAPPPKVETHTEWITRSLKQMQTVGIGRTRAELLKVFTEEGGLSTSKARTYVYRECPYIKVDVTFNIVGRPERDADGRLTNIESPDDTIKTISRPYLAWGIGD